MIAVAPVVIVRAATLDVPGAADPAECFFTIFAAWVKQGTTELLGAFVSIAPECAHVHVMGSGWELVHGYYCFPGLKRPVLNGNN